MHPAMNSGGPRHREGQDSGQGGKARPEGRQGAKNGIWVQAPNFERQTMKTCPRCKARMPDEAERCGFCGYRFGWLNAEEKAILVAVAEIAGVVAVALALGAVAALAMLW